MFQMALYVLVLNRDGIGIAKNNERNVETDSIRGFGRRHTKNVTRCTVVLVDLNNRIPAWAGSVSSIVAKKQR